MNIQHYRDMVIRALNSGDDDRINHIVNAVVEAEAAKGILRALGYGAPGQTIEAVARLVPHARYERP